MQTKNKANLWLQKFRSVLNNDEERRDGRDDETKLLSAERPDGSAGKPQESQMKTGSNNEITHSDFGSNERQPLNVNGDIDKSGQLSPSAEETHTITRIFRIPVFPKRFIILIFIALANLNMCCMRMCLNVTIVAMTHGEGNGYNTSGPHLSKDMEPEFKWNKQLQGTILASLYWSYTALQIPAGVICLRYNGSFLLGIAILGSSVLTLATPVVVRQNVYAFISLRVMEGAFLGFVSVSKMSLISKWSPIYERSIFLMVGHAGFLWGTVLANSTSGVLAGTSWGWPAVFYYFGGQGILWCLCWIYFSYEEPSDYPNISKAELELIGTHWEKTLAFDEVPWRHMLTSIRVWAIIIPFFTDYWCFYTFMISFPSYLKDVQKLDITTIGLASSLPYVVSGVCSPSWGYFIDCLRSKKCITTTQARKLSSLIGAGGSAIFIIALTYASTATAAVTILTIVITLSNLTGSGPNANIIELAPKYSGVLMGITNFAANISGFVSPEIVGVLTSYGDIRHQWAMIFHLTAGVNLLGMIFYITFGSAEKEYWADL